MNALTVKQMIEKATGCPALNLEADHLFVPFYIADMLSDAQWSAVKVARHDVADKGIVFFR